MPCADNDALRCTALRVASAVGLPLQDSDVTAVRFLVPRSLARREDVPIPILVTLRSRDLVLKLLSAKKAKGRLLSSDLQSSSATGNRVTSIFINEALPGEFYRLLVSAKTEARKFNYKYIWHKEGIVFLRKSDGARVERIHTITELRKLVRRLQSGTTASTQPGALDEFQNSQSSSNSSASTLIPSGSGSC
ncbi:hypothetical protein KPH14_012588 [Odynerus spinipes]|uniref:FP protein C-terminal domain-containing protein n=1 Tax=Odynerus spinipes TaxID=1348599 RepID=A0AAD9VL02_9HYME|nr:hypothetical protein KPH14_012588 [Odynerus spinipes]